MSKPLLTAFIISAVILFFSIKDKNRSDRELRQVRYDACTALNNPEKACRLFAVEPETYDITLGNNNE